MTCTMRNWGNPAKQQPQHHLYASAPIQMMGHDISNNIIHENNSFGQQEQEEQHRSSSRSRGGIPKPQEHNTNKTTILGEALRGAGGDSSSSCNHNSGPELLMTPIHDILTNRDASPLRTKPPVVRKARTKSTESASAAGFTEQERESSSSSLQQLDRDDGSGSGSSTMITTLASFSIPLHDIVVVESQKPQQHSYPQQVSSRGGGSGRRSHRHRRKQHHHHSQQQQQQQPECYKLLLTTMENGYLEFNCATSNGHDVLFAFLQATIPPERIVGVSNDQDTVYTHEEDRSLPSKTSQSSVNSCKSSLMDVDRLTAQQIQGAELSETWPQRMSRRVGKVVHTLTEVSETLCDNMASCCREASNGNMDTASRTSASHHGGGMSGGAGGIMNYHQQRHAAMTTESRDMPPPPRPPSSSGGTSTAMPSFSTTRSQHSAAGTTGHGTTSTSSMACLEMVDDDVASLQSSYCSLGASLSRDYFHDDATHNNKHQQPHQLDKSSTLPLSSSAPPPTGSTIRRTCRVPMSSASGGGAGAGGLSFEQADPAKETMYHTN
jgi:hypothetical protein